MINPFNRSKRYFVKFVRETSGGYEQIKQKEIKLGDKTVQYNKTSAYPLDLTKMTINIKNKAYLLIEIDKGQLNIGETTIESNTGIIDLILNTKIIRDLAQRLQPANNTNIFVAVICILLGVSVGYICGNIADISAIQYAITHIELPHW